MVLNQQTIQAYKTILDDPKSQGLSTPKWEDIFEESIVCTPKHILFKQLLDIYPALPKVIFYIIGNERFKMGKAPSGEIGYYVTIKSKVA